jgi:nucleoid-associated protein YgaU
VTVKRGDTLWKLARQSLGQGSRWRDVLAINPQLPVADHIEEGSQIYLPKAVSSRTAITLTVQNGDSLSKIARAHFGHASSWHCIASANHSIADPNLIYEGQTLSLPPSCPP